jgi:hypothetical protein
VNTGEQTIDWLYREQLQVDEQWSVRTERGFTWWADQTAQTIEILGEETGPDGDVGYLIGVRTEMVTDLDLTAAALGDLNEGPMRCAALSGPVYDAQTRTLSLCSLARVHEEIAPWMTVVIGAAAVTQIAEAGVLGPDLAQSLGAQPASSSHPQHGRRPEPDEMVYAVSLFVDEGKEPCQWPAEQFDAAVDSFMRQPPSLMASAGGQGFTVEFPYGPNSSLCQVIGTQPHPLYGNGLLVLQRFPYKVASQDKGIELALTLNGAELTRNVTGYGFGSYVYDNDMLCFTGFVPNALHRQIALPNLYFACAARARAMSLWLLDADWDDASFSPEHSAIGRKLMSDNNNNE